MHADIFDELVSGCLRVLGVPGELGCAFQSVGITIYIHEIRINCYPKKSALRHDFRNALGSAKEGCPYLYMSTDVRKCRRKDKNDPHQWADNRGHRWEG